MAAASRADDQVILCQGGAFVLQCFLRGLSKHDICETKLIDWYGFAIVLFFFDDGPRFFFAGIDASVLVLDCLFKLALVGSSKTLAIIHSNAILVAKQSESRHTGAVSLECVGLAVDDKVLAVKILHGGISDCSCHCSLGQFLWISRGWYCNATDSSC
jgi:hypothetical protein